METNQFWTLFVIAIIAGVALTFAVNDGVTGNATFWERIGLTKEVTPTTITITSPLVQPIEETSTPEGKAIKENAIIFNSKLSSLGLDDPIYGDIQKWNIAFSKIYVGCYDSFKDKDYCLAFTNAVWESGLSTSETEQALRAGGEMLDIYQSLAKGGAYTEGVSGVDVEFGASPCSCGGISCVTCSCTWETDEFGFKTRCLSCSCV